MFVCCCVFVNVCMLLSLYKCNRTYVCRTFVFLMSMYLIRILLYKLYACFVGVASQSTQCKIFLAFGVDNK